MGENAAVGRILHRAYLGSVWQYRVALPESAVGPMEVWSEAEWAKDAAVKVHLPSSRLQFLEGDAQESITAIEDLSEAPARSQQ